MTAPRISTSRTAGSSVASTDGVPEPGVVLGVVDTTEQVLIFIACWIGIGLATAILLGRRGHEFRPYAALGAVLGPVFVFFAYDVIRRRESVRPITLSPSATASGQPMLVVAVGTIEDTSSTTETVQALAPTGEVYAAVPTSYEVGERVHRQGNTPPDSDDLEDLASLLASYEPGLMMLPGPLEKSVPVAVTETGAVSVVLVGQESATAAPGLEESVAVKVIRVGSRDR